MAANGLKHALRANKKVFSFIKGIKMKPLEHIERVTMLCPFCRSGVYIALEHVSWDLCVKLACAYQRVRIVNL